ncbi:hypothetical protein [Stenoxybacter acetivorans]|uniref:hypothetical protein n=1 Tax=Stenoxybacter acetivorans TaxID=422441 RepID=UPI00068C1D98|nr:hypothetical protein [Stenoxybacter acetivorans]
MNTLFTRILQHLRRFVWAGVLLLLFILLKAAATHYWRQQHPLPETAASVAEQNNDKCDVRQGCVLANGMMIQFTPPLKSTLPFDLRISQVPPQTQTVNISFRMTDMDMGFNRYALHSIGQDTWQAQQIRLPLCVENRTDFWADISIGQQLFSVPFSISP